MKVEIMPTAEADLRSVRSYIGRESPRASDRIGRKLLEACFGLADLPYRGRPGLQPDTRELTTVWPYVVVYRVAPTRIEILRIWHGSQARGGGG